MKGNTNDIRSLYHGINFRSLWRRWGWTGSGILFGCALAAAIIGTLYLSRNLVQPHTIALAQNVFDTPCTAPLTTYPPLVGQSAINQHFNANACINPATGVMTWQGGIGAVPSLNNICFALTLAQLNACNAGFNVNSPGISWVPSNAPAFAFPTTPNNGVMWFDTRFINDGGQVEGGLPNTHSHLQFDFHAGANDAYEANPSSGPTGLTVQGFADAGGTPGTTNGAASLVSLYSVAKRTGGDRPIWAGAFQIGFSTINTMATGVEIDSANNSGTDDSANVTAAMRIVGGGGTARNGTAIFINGSGVNVWEIGASINNYHQNGIQLQASDTTRTADLYIIPPDNTATASIIVRDSANANSIFQVNNNGNTQWKETTNISAFAGFDMCGGNSTLHAIGCTYNNSPQEALLGPPYAGTSFASLGTPTNGTLRYCPDCTIANPCAGAGNGALAKRLNGVWVCN